MVAGFIFVSRGRQESVGSLKGVLQNKPWRNEMSRPVPNEIIVKRIVDDNGVKFEVNSDEEFFSDHDTQEAAIEEAMDLAAYFQLDHVRLQVATEAWMS
jgi:hypothetical protein